MSNERKSKSWMETVADFIPRWPKRQDSNLSEVVVINKSPEKFDRANKSAPADLDLGQSVERPAGTSIRLPSMDSFIVLDKTGKVDDFGSGDDGPIRSSTPYVRQNHFIRDDFDHMGGQGFQDPNKIKNNTRIKGGNHGFQNTKTQFVANKRKQDLEYEQEFLPNGRNLENRNAHYFNEYEHKFESDKNRDHQLDENEPYKFARDNKVEYNEKYRTTRSAFEPETGVFISDQSGPNRPELLSQERLINQEKGPYGPSIDNKSGDNKNQRSRRLDCELQKQALISDRQNYEYDRDFENYPKNFEPKYEPRYDYFEPQKRFGNDYQGQNKNDRLRRQREPDKYDGQKVEWSDYIKHFETVSNWNYWSYEEKGLQLAMSLQGDAQSILGDLRQTHGCIDYNILINELSYRFNPPDREFTFRMEFKARCKNSNETVMQYGYALRRLAAKAFPTISINCQEQLILDQFISGLGNIEIRKHVQFGHPRNLNEAISLATEFESFENKPQSKFFKPGHLNTVSSSNNDSSENLLKQLYATVEQNTKELVNLKNHIGSVRVSSNENNFTHKNEKSNFSSDSKRTIRCFRCNMEGHYQRECPVQIQSNNKGSNNYRNSHSQGSGQKNLN